MDIEGTYTLEASPEEVWHSLMNQELLRHALPNIQQLDSIDEHSYAVTLHINHAPLTGTYYGHISISDKQYPYHYRLLIEEGGAQQNTLQGSGIVLLSSHGHTTIITYKVSLQLAKTGKRLSAAVLRGAANLLIQHYFTVLADFLRTQAAAQVVTTEEAQAATAVTASEPFNDEIVIQPAPPVSQMLLPFKLETLFHSFRRRAANAVQEAHWTRRIRRLSITSALLFLVWIGTRLPRK